MCGATGSSVAFRWRGDTIPYMYVCAVPCTPFSMDQLNNLRAAYGIAPRCVEVRIGIGVVSMAAAAADPRSTAAGACNQVVAL